MQKNALQPLALLLIVTVFVVALCLPGSVAQLRAAATASAAPSVEETVAVRAIYGPRRHQIRRSDLLSASSSSFASSVASVPSVPLISVQQPKSRLDILLDQSGISQHQRPLAEAVLGLLDPACQEKLRTFSVLYNNPTHRGLAGKGVIIVSGTVPDQEFIGLLLHEGLGHFRDITCLTGDPTSGASAFRDGDDLIYNDDPSIAFYRISWESEKKQKAHAVRRDFVTGYAFESDNFEDLAESVTYYMTQEQAFRERATKSSVLAEKLAWLETYMPKKTAVAEGNEWDGKIAWDATKLGFHFTNEHALAEVGH